MHLARFAPQVTLLVRGESLAAGMSDYLIRQIERRRTSRLACKRGWSKAAGSGACRRSSSRMIERDARGFVLTGHDIPVSAWPLARPPMPFEASLPGVFAVGDVRYGSIKRVAEAVGEGSVAVRSMRRYGQPRSCRVQSTDACTPQEATGSTRRVRAG